MANRGDSGSPFLELPEGTVTLLFTDIEGSTKLLHELGAKYTSLLTDHHRILREIWRKWNGREMGTEGDAFFVAFPKATQAVAAAAAAQQALARHDWHEGVSVKVRMGVHTGEPWVFGEDYAGLAVHRAARIAHVGHGGQVLLSETTAALVMDELPTDVTLLDLGRHLLKDMHRPEHIRQLVIEGLASDFPPLTSQASLPAEMERPPREVGGSPYRGLAAFREADAPFYFGRESFINTLEEAIKNQPLVAVIVGASGSGKSSALFAGLLPRLRKESGWLVVALRPGGQPFYALAGALLPLLEEGLGETDRLVESRKMAQKLTAGEVTLLQIADRVLEKLGESRQLLLILDQFEELYTLCPDKKLQHRFIDQLLDIIASGQGRRQAPGVVLMTMRADFMGQALGYRPWADALQEASLLMGPMNREELRAAIEKPADKQGAAFEPGLVERILDDVGDKPGNLPLLEFTLAQLWEAQDDGWLNHEDYEKLGGVEGALARYADQVHESLSVEEREGARGALIQLVRPGEGTEDTRRVAAREELGDDKWALIRHLADRRLVVTGRDANGRETAEVVHEALIQRWDRFQDWMAGDRAFRAWQERLRVGIRTWQESEEDPGSLLSGVALEVAENWLAERPESISPSEAAFISAGAELRRRQRVEAAQKRKERERLRRRVTWVLLAGLLTAVILVGVVAWQWSKAQRNFIEAHRQRLSSEALNLISGGASGELPALLALNSLEIGYSPEAQAALYRALDNGFTRIRLDAGTSAINITFSPDGRYLLTGSDGNGLRIWDRATGQEVRRFTGGQGFAIGRFSPDGRLILSAGQDGMIRLWETETGRDSGSWDAHNDSINNVEFSPDGTQILSVSNDQTARLWDASTGLLVQSYTMPPLEGIQNPNGGTENWVMSSSFSPDGRTFLTGSIDLLVREWDVDTGESRRTYLHDSGQGIAEVHYSPDGHFMLSVPGDSTAVLWEVESGERVRTLTLPPDVLLISAAFSPDARAILTGSDDNLIRLWDRESGQLRHSYTGHNGNVQWLAFSPDGLSFASSTEDGEVRLWDIQLESEPIVLRGQTGRVFDIALAPEGRTLLVSDDEDEHVWLWDVPSGDERARFPGHADGTLSVAFAGNGRRVATAGWDGVVRIWDVETGAGLNSFQIEDHFINPLEFSPDGRFLVAGDGSGLVHRWDANTGEEFTTYSGHEAEIWSLDFSADGQLLLSGSWDGTARLWDMASGVERLVLPEHEGAVTAALFLPGEDTILTTSDDQLLRFWDRGSGDLLRQFPITAGRFSQAAISEDGRFLYLGGGDDIARRYDLENGLEDRRFVGHTEFIHGVALSPDGRRLYTGSWDGTVRVWRTDIDELITFICRQLPRGLTVDERAKYAIDQSKPTCQKNEGAD